MTSPDAIVDAAERDGTAHITYSEWEPDPDALPIYVADRWRPIPGVDRYFGVPPLKLRPQTGGYRRHRYVTAVAPDGRRVGRWTWERKPA